MTPKFLVIVNTEDKENRNILPLKDSLDALGITDIKNNVNPNLVRLTLA